MNPEHFTAVQNLLKHGWTTNNTSTYYALSCDEANERTPKDVEHLLLTNPIIRNTKLGHKVKKLEYKPEYDIFYRLRFDECLSKIDWGEGEGLYEMCEIKRRGKEALMKIDEGLGYSFASFCIWWNLTTRCKHLYETWEEKQRRLEMRGKITIAMTSNGSNGWEKTNKYKSSHRTGYEKDHHRKYIADPHKKQ